MHIPEEHRAGFYFTVSFHLAVVIVLLLVGIGSELGVENSFVMDFSRQEQKEKEIREEEFRESISRRLDELISGAEAPVVRNVTVDNSAPLKDDRGTDAEELYRENERLQRDLKALDSRHEDAVSETVDIEPEPEKENPGQQKAYSGPSVLSWTLDGRKASHLKVPAYKCYNAGDVTVMIKVNNQGTVVYAKVVDELSSEDDCLRKNAVRAARSSRFSINTDAPANQPGEITYRFVAQR
ncbi:MAG: energy transducer TonB [Candidatus Cryptobacteroides sp.]